MATEMIEHVLVIERVGGSAVKRKLPQAREVSRCQRPKAIRTERIAMNLDLNLEAFDVFRRGRQVMMTDEARNGRPQGRRESELGQHSLGATRQLRIHQQVYVAHRSQARIRVEHMGERGSFEDDGLDSSSAERIEHLTEHA